jgi:hypothetical protein
VVFVSGSFGTASSTITSAHSPWQRMARAKEFASRIAKSLDQKGVIMRSSIRMAQPCCSLTTLNVIIAITANGLQEIPYFATSLCAGRLKLQMTMHSTTRRIGGVDLYQTFSGDSGSCAPALRQS